MSEPFTKIAGVSDLLRLPVIGRIRLGLKAVSKNGVSYPSETSYFVVDDGVKRIYGLQPKTLDIVLPSDDISIIFPERFELYGSSGLKCCGDGKEGRYRGEDGEGWKAIACPCSHSKKDCVRRGRLFFLLPRVCLGGCFLIAVSSVHSIVSINSTLNFLKTMLGGFSRLPLKLVREPYTVTRESKRETHYGLKILFEAGIDDLRSMRSGGRFLPEYVGPGPGVKDPDPAGDDLPSPEGGGENLKKRGMVG